MSCRLVSCVGVKCCGTSYIVLYQARWRHCDSGRGTHSPTNGTYYFATFILLVFLSSSSFLKEVRVLF